jgi:O-antigen/teichoic acid export membrane protein
MLKNGIYNVVGALTRLILNFLTIPLLIRFIGVEEYGLWTLVSTVLIVAGLAEGGLSLSTTVFLSRDIANEDIEGISKTLTITATAMLGLGTVGALILWLASQGIVGLFNNLSFSQSSKAISALKISAIVLWARLLQQIFIGVEQAYQKYGLLNILNTLQVILNSLGMIVVAWLGGKVVALMQWQLVAGMLILALHCWASLSLLSKAKPKFKWSMSKSLEIMRYGFSTWFISLGSTIFQQGDRLIVGAVLGTKLLGVYAAITSITTQINLLSGVAVQPLLPRLGSLLEGEKKYLEKQIKLAVQTSIIIAFGLGGFLIILSRPLTRFFFVEMGDKYTLAFGIAAIIYSIYSINAVGYYILLGISSVKLPMIINILAGIFSLTLIYIGADKWGLLGAILGNAGYISTVVFVFVAMQSLNISIKEWTKWLMPSEILSSLRYFSAKLYEKLIQK